MTRIIIEIIVSVCMVVQLLLIAFGISLMDEDRKKGIIFIVLNIIFFIINICTLINLLN